MHIRLTLLAVLALAGSAGATAAAAPAGGDTASTPTARTSSYGRILFDGRGFALYAFTRDPRGRSACSGDCAKAWPPYLVRTRPNAGGGVTRSLLGTVRRTDRTLQVTYRGHPLYYYVGDRKPGQVLCQNVREFGGLWLVVRPTGDLVR